MLSEAGPGFFRPQVPWRLCAWVAVAGVAVWFALRADLPIREGISAMIALVRSAGPLAYFAAMAVLPTPLFWFTIPAGEAFANELTMSGVVLAAVLAVTANITLHYALARALRPALLRLAARRGWTIPQVTDENSWTVALIVKLTPGPPLFLQCYVLGMAGVRFRIYFLVTWLLTVPWVIGGVVLGKGVLGGNVSAIVSGASVLVAVALAVRWLRERSFKPLPVRS